MAWRKLTEDDLTATMSVAELASYKKSSQWKSDPVEKILTRIAARVRSYIRTNGKVVMSPDPEEIPESCVDSAVAVAVYQIATRLNGTPNDARLELKKSGESYLKSISSRWITPESYGAAEDDASAGPAAEVVESEASKFENMEGL